MEPSPDNDHDLWNTRYKKEGHIWGDVASPSARLLAATLNEPTNIFEVGFGYGRDLIFLAQNNHCISGMDHSKVGINEAQRQFKKLGFPSPQLFYGDFTTSINPEKLFGAILCHRMLHLLTEDDAIITFAENAYKLLNQNGLLCVAARNFSDFDSFNMERLTEKIVVYKSRPDHIISFWDESQFKNIFEEKFDILFF